jgi:16S rRNA processing protein RimM
MAEKTFRVGQIVGGFGLRGQVKVEALTDFEERFAPGTRLLLKGEWVTIDAFTMHKGRPLLKLSGVNDLTAAEKLQWEYLEYVGDDRPELDEDEFLTEDLIGLRVVTVEGHELGEVDNVLDMPAHDVLQVREVLIPAVKEFVKDIDLEKGVITVELIPGMLPGEEA